MSQATIDRREEHYGSHGWLKPRLGPDNCPRAVVTCALSFLVVALILLAYSALFIPSYNSCDDVRMAMTASGCGIFSKPDEHLRDSHVLIGLALKTLYCLNSNVPWYGGYLLMVHAIGMTAILFVFLQQGFRLTKLSVCLLFFAVSEMSCLANLTFTSTGAFIAQAGALVMLYCLERDRGETGNRPGLWILSAFLILAGLLIRIRSGELSILLAVLFLFSRYFRLPKPDTRLVRGCAFLTSVLMLALLLWQFDYWYYERDRSWQDLYAFESIKVNIVDFNRLCARSKAVSAVGWSLNDVACFENFLFLDPQVCSLTKLRRLQEGFCPHRCQLSARYVIDTLRRAASDPFTLPALLTVLCSLWFLDRRKLGIARGSIFIASGVALVIYLVCFMKLEQRVYLPILSFMVLHLLYCVDLGYGQVVRQRLSGLQLQRRLAVVGLAGALTAFCAFTLYQLHRSTTHRVLAGRQLWKAAIAELKPNSNQLFVILPSPPPIWLISPLENPSAYFGSMNMLWPSLMPFAAGEARMRQAGAANLEELLHRKKVFFVAINGSPSIELLKRFVEEHYRESPEFRLKYQCQPLRFGVYQVTSSRAAHTIGPTRRV